MNNEEINEQERTFMNNVLRLSTGMDTDIVLSGLIRIFDAILTGVNRDKEGAIKMIEVLTKHLVTSMETKEPKVFGYLLPDENADKPILSSKVIDHE